MAFPMIPPAGPPMGGGGMPPMGPPSGPPIPQKKKPAPNPAASAKNKALASKLGKGKGGK